MERLFNCSLLEKLYEDRNEDLSHIIIKKCPEYKKSRKEIEEKLNEILNYVPGELYKELQDEILALKQEVRNLKTSIEIAKTEGEETNKNVSSVDVLKRLSQLEKIVYGKDE